MNKLLFTLTAIVLLGIGTASARVLYVALDGTGDYTSHQAAFAASLNGDTILIAPGDYGTTGATLSGRSNVVVAGTGFSATPYVSVKIGGLTLTNCSNCE